MAAVSQTEIAILGGQLNLSIRLGNGVKLDTNRMRFKSLIDTKKGEGVNSLKFSAIGNQYAMVKKEKILTFVEDQSFNLYFISYELGQSKVKIIEDIGLAF